MGSKRPVSSDVSDSVRLYLVLYNLFQFAGWLRILVGTLLFMCQGPGARPMVFNWLIEALENVRPIMVMAGVPSYASLPFPISTVLQRASLLYNYIDPLLMVFQTLQSVEVLHALFGWVKANPLVVAIQVASRLAIVWLVVEPYQAAATSPWYGLLVLAWSLSEVGRYPFYINQLLNSQSYMALWARYSFFVALYPLGVLAEMQLIWTTLPHTKAWPWENSAGWTQRDILFLALLPVYIPGLAFLYSRMFMARRKSLGDDFAGTKGLQIIRKRQAEYSARISRPLAPSKPKADTEVVEAELAVDEM